MSKNITNIIRRLDFNWCALFEQDYFIDLGKLSLKKKHNFLWIMSKWGWHPHISIVWTLFNSYFPTKWMYINKRFVKIDSKYSIPWVCCRAVRRQKKGASYRRLRRLKAPIHSKCCIGGFRETGLALVIVLRCDWPLCDIWFKSYEHFKIKMFLVQALYRPRTGLAQASYRRLAQAPGKKAAPWRLLGACAPFLTLAP